MRLCELSANLKVIAVKNKLIVIGWMGGMTAYLNVSREEAIRRYTTENDDTYSVKEIEFDNEFEVYDAWAKN